MAPIEREIRLRVVLVAPPTGVLFALRHSKERIVAPTLASGGDIHVDLYARARREVDGAANFLGEYVLGPRGQRHIGIWAGVYAGQQDSCWSRMAKVTLQPIGWAQVEQAAVGGLLVARIAGIAKDGGPPAASVPLLDGGWLFVREEPAP